MKKLREIVEATKSLHPMALHVKPVMVNGQQKYHVHAVGKDLADGIKHGEHLSDSELDDAHEMGAKVKHVKEEVQIDELKASTVAKYQDKAFDKYMGGDDKRAKGLDRANKKQVGALGHVATTNEAESHQAKTTMKHIPNASPALKKAAKDIKPGIAGFRDRIAMLKAGGVKEETDFGPEADKNITVQLKKAMDMMEHGEKSGSEIEFADGQKYFVEGVVAHKVLVAMEQMKPEIRAQAQNAVYQSFAHLMAAHQMLSK